MMVMTIVAKVMVDYFTTTRMDETTIASAMANYYKGLDYNKQALI